MSIINQGISKNLQEVRCIDVNIEKIQDYIDDLQNLYDKKLNYSSDIIRIVELKIRNTIVEIFGESSVEGKNKCYIQFWTGGYNSTDGHLTRQKKYETRLSGSIKILTSLICDLEKKRDTLHFDLYKKNLEVKFFENNFNHNREVLIVGGSNNDLKNKIQIIIEDIGLEPVILNEANSKTAEIINKDYLTDSFVIVLLSLENTDSLQDKNSNDSRVHLHQNIIFQIGLFLGSSGSDRVCILNTNIDNSSLEYLGIPYLTMDDGGGWKGKIGKKLQNVGYEFDFGKLF